MDHYEQYNRNGRVTRDTGDWTHVPIHVRITNHPERKRLAVLKEANKSGPTKITPEDVEEIRRMAAEGYSLATIRTRFELSDSRTQRIVSGGDPGPVGQIGRPRKATYAE